MAAYTKAQRERDARSRKAWAGAQLDATVDRLATGDHGVRGGWNRTQADILELDRRRGDILIGASICKGDDTLDFKLEGGVLGYYVDITRGHWEKTNSSWFAVDWIVDSRKLMPIEEFRNISQAEDLL